MVSDYIDKLLTGFEQDKVDISQEGIALSKAEIRLAENFDTPDYLKPRLPCLQSGESLIK